MWHQGEGEMPLNVFNSTTVYLREKKKMRKGGRERDAILVLTLSCGGYFDCCHHLNHAFNLPHRSCL